MGPSSHRSPSPLATRANPNSRTPESGSNARRSFSGNSFTTKPSSIVAHPRSFNPTTPANSPSDFGRRILISKEGVISSRDDEQKENEKDLNTKPSVRVKSPAFSKGAKNFMSPTISAVSKFTPSPRKKILTERTEQVRTSISSSEGKCPFGSLNPNDLDLNPVTGLDPKKIEASSDSTTTESDSNPYALKKDAISCSKVPLSSHDSSEYDAVTVDHKEANLKRESETIAPLDADPSLPPYDPKTNYLSPRPRFLHYKPNPRIEAYLSRERDGVSEEETRLEDRFASEGFLDTESSEETQSESSQEEYKDVVSSIESSAEVDVHSPDVSESEAFTITDSVYVSEVKSFNTHLLEVTEEPTWMPKRHCFARSKTFPLILIMVVACLSISVIDSPVISYSTFKDQASFLEPHQTPAVAVFVRSKPDGFGRTLQLWSVYYASYFSRLVENLRKVDNLGSLCYGNFTVLPEDTVFDEGMDGEQGHQVEEAYDDIESDLGGKGCSEEDDSLVVHEGEQSEEERGVALHAPEASEVEPELSEAADEPFRMPETSENGNLMIVHEEQTDGVMGGVAFDMQNIIDFQFELISTSHVSEVDSEVSEAAGHRNKNDLKSKSDPDIENASQEQGNPEEHESFLVHGQELAEEQSPQASQNSIDRWDELNSMPQALELESEGPESAEADHTEAVESIVAAETPRHGTDSPEELILEPGALKYEGQNDVDSFSKIRPAEGDISSELGNSQSSETADHTAMLTTEADEKYYNGHKILAVLLLVLLTPAAATAITRTRQATNTSKAAAAAPTGQPPLTKKLIWSSKSPAAENATQERSNRNRPMEYDTITEACFSGMSSSYSKGGGLRWGNEDRDNLWKPRNYKRESLASSSSEYSMGTPSFGSFTTYEKIACKRGEEEIATPVRRSSRIQSKVTSP